MEKRTARDNVTCFRPSIELYKALKLYSKEQGRPIGVLLESIVWMGLTAIKRVDNTKKQ